MHLLHILLSDLNPFWDKNIMTLISGIKDSLPDQALITVAKEVAAVFALIYLSVRAYAMIVGEGRFEVMPLFRPFLITLAIINFSLVTEVVGYPGSKADDIGKTSFEANAEIMNTDLDTKDMLTDSLFATLISHTTELAQMYVQSAKEGETFLEDVAHNVITLGGKELMLQATAHLTVLEQLLWIKLSMWLQQFITWIVLGVFKGICYCLFFLQLILMYVLACVGPLSFAFSIAGPFKDSWVTWAARYIAVSFYSTIGFIILNISCAIIDYGLLQEIDRLRQLLAKADVQAQFLAAVQHIDNFVGYLFIALVTAFSGIVATPIVSTWILGAVGTGNAFIAGMKGAAAGAVGAGGAAAGRAVQPVKSLAGAIAKS